ncbi:MAG: hypothetical protein HUK15_04195, partial [Bacteroidales bacterium]|nr:hypothetical protein [Bacteroidales bacterium]
MNRVGKIGITISLLIISLISSAQVAVGQWQDHLSYNYGKQVVVIGTDVFLLSEGGILRYDKETFETEKLTRLNALSDVNPTQMAYNENNGQLIIGYQSGNVDIIEGNEVVNISDIKNVRNLTQEQ